ncbi:MAG: sensor histidine kinase [Winogradskyella sp.]|jgi:two-component sensor histidine kinase
MLIKKSLSLYICFSLVVLSNISQLQAQKITKDSINSIFGKIKSVGNSFDNDILKICSKIDAQKNALDLYEYMDSIAPTQKSKLLFYNKYIGYLIRINSTSKALKLSDIAIQLSEKFQFDRFNFEYSQIKSYGYLVTSKLDSALEYANKAEKLVTNNSTLLGRYHYKVFLLRAEIEILLGNEEQGSLEYENAVKSLEPYPDDKNNAYVLATVALHFKTTKNYLKHAYYSQKLKAYYLRNGGYNNPKTHLNISSFLEFEDSEDQLEALKKAIGNSAKSSLTLEQRLHLNDLAEGLIKANKPKEAIQYLEYYVKDNDTIPIIHKLLSYQLLEEAYSQINDCNNTLEAARIKASLIDSLRTQKMIVEIADSKVKYETEKKEAQLKFLKLEKEKENQKKNLFTIIGILVFIVFTVIIYFLRKNAMKSKLLSEQNKLLERTVDEKNILLKEIHHRVKNSFQIVSSLLYLQSENIEDKEAKLAIKEAENRVRSMVLVHQKLYSKDELVGINTEEYFGDLVRDIFESHQFKTVPIAYELDVEPLVLDIETITPLGLILNELIVNTLKHAFKVVDEKSKLAINLHHENEALVLKVKDNGSGFEGEIKPNSFGIKLIKALSKKLKATIDYHSKPDEGTEAILEIKKFNLIS